MDIERCESNSLMLWPLPDLRPLRYYYCDVSGSNWFDLSQSSWPELVRSTCTKHKGLELFSYLNLKDRTLPYSRTLCRALPCPHFFFEGG